MIHSKPNNGPRPNSRRAVRRRARRRAAHHGQGRDAIIVLPPAAAAPSVAEEAPPTPWRNSTAKRLLQSDIISGRINQFSGPTALYFSRPEYQRYKKLNFSSNYYTLKKSTESRIIGAARGRQAIARDSHLLATRRNRSTRFQYNGSELQRVLRHDVLSGVTNGKTPTQVRLSRPIYKQAPLTTQEFSSHLWHERRRRERAENAEEYHERMQFVTALVDPNHHEESKTDEEGEDE